MSYAEVPSRSRGGNTVAIVIGILAALLLMFMVCAGLLAAMLLPAVQSAREAARRMSCSNNVRQIGLAILNYESAYKKLPPAYTVDAKGNKLHSWRTLILPFMEQSALYQQIDFTVPWNDPRNAAFMNMDVPAYRCPSTNLPPGQTLYVAIVDPKAMFEGEKQLKIADIKDGINNTVMIYETSIANSVNWMTPEDGDIEAFIDAIRSANNQTDKLAHNSGTHCVFGDCSVRFLPRSTDPKSLKGIATKDGGEVVSIND